jgi:uncharacterized protein YndB with AHSA1/START domain
MPEPATTRTAGQTTADRTLVIERIFSAPPDRVFRAWTDPATLAKWWGPEGFTTPEYKMDVRPGGKYRTTMVSPTGESHTCSGVYREVVPAKRLVFTWAWEENGKRGHETEVTVTFEPTAGGTKMHFVQAVFDSAEQRDNHSQGWASSFNDLARVLT